jgi:hypothetical protein
MPSSALALQQAVFERLTTDAGVLALLGGAPRVYDDTPQPAEFPYITFGQSTLRDADTDGRRADEHVFTLHIWSRGGGRRECHRLIDVLRTTLHDQPMALDGHWLVNLRHEFSEARRDSDGETLHGIVRFRALTEPL